MNALKHGFECECDVWYHKEKYWLGHDEPQYEICPEFLSTPKLWIHAKNYEALQRILRDFPDVHVFFHDKDPYTITSQQYIWAYPGQPVNSYKTICVMPERVKYTIREKNRACGICSDFIVREQIEQTFQLKFM